MPVGLTEIELPLSGIGAGSALKGAFAQNLFIRSGSWEVRAGMGQLSQLDSTFSQPFLPVPTTYGYSEILGRFIFKNDFGARQILTVLRVIANTSNCKAVVGFGAQSQVIDGVVLRVYDCMTKGSFEFPLFRHTSQNNPAVISPLGWHGCYETNLSQNWQSFVRGTSQRVFFTEFQDFVLFGCPDIGAWCYRPILAAQPRQMMVDGVNVLDNAEGYSETSACFPVVYGNGIASEAQGYLDATGGPPPVDAVSIAGRICYAFKRDLFFSDVGNPQGIMQLNVMTLPTQADITAVAEVFGNLLIFTQRETWLYRLSTGTFCTGGQLSRLSDTVGCIGPQTKTSIGESLAWCDARGVYTSSGQYDIKCISDDLQQLFSAQMANPLTYYFQTVPSVYQASNDERERFEYEWKDTASVSMCYEALQDLLLITVPSFNGALCFKDGQWSLWNFDTVVTPTARFAAVTRNIVIDGLLAIDGEIYATGGIETYTPDDKAITAAGTPLLENSPQRSFYILQYDRGGAVDRTVEIEEDQRLFAGYYQIAQSRGTAEVYLGQPVKMPFQYKTPTGAIVGGVGDNLWLVPLIVIPSDNAAVFPLDHFDFIVSFDSTHYAPIFRTDNGFGQAFVDVILEPERGFSQLGWGVTPAGTPPIATVGVSEIQAYLAGVPSLSGSELRIRWDGAQGLINGGAWNGSPNMNVNARKSEILMWIPMQDFRSLSTATTMSMAWAFSVSMQKNIASSGSVNLVPGSWHNANPGNRHQLDDVAQPVDWLYKSEQVQCPVGMRGVKAPMTQAREAFIDAILHGQSNNPVISAWIFGLIQGVFSTDWKDWSGQVMDFIEYENDESAIASLISRMQGGATGFTGRTFGNAATWGDDADKTKGNYLNCDEERDTLPGSGNVKGKYVSLMLFGHVQNVAERLVILGLKAGLRPAGGRRIYDQ